MFTRFRNRAEAGRALASELAAFRDLKNVVVLALPRGGVPVGYEIAHALHAPLDVLNVRKLGVPWHEELAMGALAAGGVRVLNDEVIMALGVTKEALDDVTNLQQMEIDRRERLYRRGRPAPELRGRVVIIVDDGIATGATVRAAISVVRAQSPATIVLAVPVAQASVVTELKNDVDEIVTLLSPSDLFAIGVWYDDFRQLDDADVQSILARAAAEPAAALIDTGPRAGSLDGEASVRRD